MRTKLIYLFFLFMFFQPLLYAQSSYLREYQKQAVENSPKVKSVYNLYLSDEEKVSSTSSLPNTELKLSYLPESMMQVNGEQVAIISLMQMFPWFGTLKSEKQEMRKMSASNKYFIEEYASEVAYNVAKEYYELVSLQAEIFEIENKIKINKEKQNLTLANYTSMNEINTSTSSMKNMSSSSSTSNVQSSMSSSSMGGMNMGGNTSNTKTKTNTSSMQSMEMSSNMSQNSGMTALLRLQLEEESLENDKLKLIKRQKQKETNFALLLGKTNFEKIVVEDTLTMEDDYLVEKDFETIVQKNAHLKMLSLMGESLQEKMKMNKKMAYPMFGLGVDYMINKQTHMPKMESMNGKNMFMAMFSLSLPLNVKKNKATVQSVYFAKQQNNQEIEQAVLDLRLRYNDIVSEKENLKSDIQLLNKQEKILQDILQISLSQYTTTNTSLSEIYSLQEELLSIRTKKIKAIADFMTLTAEEQTFTSENIKHIDIENIYKQ